MGEKGTAVVLRLTLDDSGALDLLLANRGRE